MLFKNSFLKKMKKNTWYTCVYIHVKVRLCAVLSVNYFVYSDISIDVFNPSSQPSSEVPQTLRQELDFLYQEFICLVYPCANDELEISLNNAGGN